MLMSLFLQCDVWIGDTSQYGGVNCRKGVVNNVNDMSTVHLLCLALL